MEKEQRRAKRVAERRANPTAPKDSDLEGMTPGPQPDQIV